jgi:hypothetical protein
MNTAPRFKTGLATFLLFFGIMLFPLTHPARGADINELRWGELLQTGKGKLLLTGGELIQMTDRTRVIRNGRPSSAEHLAVGDRLFITVPEDGGAAILIESLLPSLMGKAAFSSASGPVIWSLRHSAKRPLRKGELLNITMKASAGGRASCRLAGKEDEIPLRETAPGTYRGSWKVPAGCDVNKGALVGILKKASNESPPFISDELSLAPSPPRIEQRSPDPGGTVMLKRPFIFVVASSRAEAMDPSGFRIWLNGRELTFRSSRNGNTLLYSPEADIPAGENEVRVRLRDRAGNSTESKWSFTAR